MNNTHGTDMMVPATVLYWIEHLSDNTINSDTNN